MNGGYGRSFITVAAIHIAIVALLMISGAITSCKSRKDVATTHLPISFVTDIPTRVIPAPPEPKAPPPPPEPKKVPEPKQTPKKKKTPVKKPDPPKRVIRNRDVSVQPPQLTKHEIEKMLNPAAPQRNTRPTAALPSDSMYRSVIYQTFYDAWDNQPSYDDAGGSEATALITIGPNGTVTGRKLLRKSGNATLDSSVLQLINSIKRIPGLSDDFIERHRTVRVSFKVQE